MQWTLSSIGHRRNLHVPESIFTLWRSLSILRLSAKAAEIVFLICYAHVGMLESRSDQQAAEYTNVT